MKSEEKYQILVQSVASYPKQLLYSWNETQRIFIPKEYQDLENVILIGMGGSALAGRIIKFLLSKRLRLPFDICTQYVPPNFVNKKTLVISSSYSGNTEETIFATHQAYKKQAKIFGISQNGSLLEFFKKKFIPHFTINSDLNPSNQPRMGLGFFLGCLFSLFDRLGIADVNQKEIKDSILTINEVISQHSFREDKSQKNILENYVNEIQGKFPLIIASEHLVGVAHAVKNQINENSKTFAVSFDIPELNHHLMEGLAFPSKLRQIVIFLFIESELYSQAVLKRYPLTKNVVEKNGYHYISYPIYSKTLLSQAFEVLTFGSLLSISLAKANNTDPLEIPWVNYFKKLLAK